MWKSIFVGLIFHEINLVAIEEKDMDSRFRGNDKLIAGFFTAFRMTVLCWISRKLGMTGARFLTIRNDVFILN